MNSQDLFTLYQLHLIDLKIANIRRRAANLDPGRDILNEIEASTKEFKTKEKAYLQLKNELSELEDNQSTRKERLTKIEKDMYQTGISARELENLQKETENAKKQADIEETRMLEIMEEIPPFQSEYEKASQELERLKTMLKTHQVGIIEEKKQLEQDFKISAAERPELAKKVKANLLKQYTSIKNGCDGIGMSEIGKDRSCGQCGMLQPERVLEAVKEDRLITCDSCHRILFILHNEA